MEVNLHNEELITLLDLDGEVYWLSSSYYVKFSVKKVEPTKHIPHGISNSLTLHDRLSRRIVGFDNAHVPKSKKRKRVKYSGRIVAYDHVHKHDKITPYDFESPAQLLNDFWNLVDEVLS
jgi:hypothetical protein